ncbi:MAG: MurR/RpiR family transcriptional regulator [Actinobacteria bacterium]|nr:MurR/RpiR family transcriptional regulator [Actinomycetota bacterium]
MAELRVTERIRLQLGRLSPAERRVARALLSGAPTVGLQSSTQLARHAGVSGPTVSRFVTGQLGFASYAAFQRALREEISTRVMSPVEYYRQHQVERAPTDLLARSGAALGQAVTASVQSLDPAEFSRAASLLAGLHHQVLATGGWFSHLVAGYLASVLREIRPGARPVPPVASERAAALADIGRKDVVAVFDFRRYERDTQEFARAAKAAGASILLFTDPWLSPIADAADVLVISQFAGPSPFASLAPAFAVAETLLTAVADMLGDSARARFERFGGIADRWIRPWPGHTGDEPAGPGPDGWLP